MTGYHEPDVKEPSQPFATLGRVNLKEFSGTVDLYSVPGHNCRKEYFACLIPDKAKNTHPSLHVLPVYFRPFGKETEEGDYEEEFCRKVLEFLRKKNYDFENIGTLPAA